MPDDPGATDDRLTEAAEIGVNCADVVRLAHFYEAHGDHVFQSLLGKALRLSGNARVLGEPTGMQSHQQYS